MKKPSYWLDENNAVILGLIMAMLVGICYFMYIIGYADGAAFCG